MKKDILENFAKFTRKHLCRPHAWNFVNKETLAQVVFFVNFVKFLRTPFLQNTSGQLLLLIELLAENAKAILIYAGWQKSGFFVGAQKLN